MPLDQTHQHSSADIMDADNPHTPINPGGGSPQSVSLLGPYHVDWNDAGIDGAGVPIGLAIAAGTVLVTVFMVITETWTAVSGAMDFLQVKTVIGGNSIYDAIIVAESVGPWVDAEDRPPRFILDADTTKVVAGTQDLVALASGGADIYALIATPA